MITDLQVSPTRRSSHFGDGSKPYESMMLCIVHAFLGAFAKLRKGTISFVMSVRPSRPHGTTRIAMDGFAINL